MTLNPHQFVGQQLWYVRGTSKRGPITVGNVKDDPNGFFITDPNTKITHSVGRDELHSSDESATESINTLKEQRKAKKNRQVVPDTSDMAQLAKFLGVQQRRR